MTKLGGDEEDDDSFSEDSDFGKESECLGDVVTYLKECNIKEKFVYEIFSSLAS